MGVNRDGSSAAIGGTGTATTVVNASGLVGNARPTRLHHPPVLLPVGKERDGGGGGGGGGGKSEDEDQTTTGGDGQVVTTSKKDRDGEKRSSQGYCIAIYPYLAEREDEFDVAVGDSELSTPLSLSRSRSNRALTIVPN